MKRWIAPSILALFVVGMLIYGINFYQQEQIEQAKEPIRGEIIVYTDLPNTLTAMLAERYEEEQKVKVHCNASYRGTNVATVGFYSG